MSRGKIQGPATGPLSSSAPPSNPVYQELRLQGHLLFEPELCDVPLLKTQALPPRLTVQPPASLSHTCQGGSIHSERGGVRGVSVAGPAPPAPPQQLFALPPSSPSFHDVTSRHCPRSPSVPHCRLLLCFLTAEMPRVVGAD